MESTKPYRERRIDGGKQHKNKPHPKESPSQTRELHLVKMDISRLSDSRKLAENEKTRAEFELFGAKMKVKELSSRTEASSAKARARKDALRLLKKPEKCKGEQVIAELDNLQYMELIQELEMVKQELSKLKLGMASVLEEKARAEEETEASAVTTKSYLSSVEELRKEIEELNEESVLVELARIEAIRESGEIEAQREAEAAQFSKNMNETKARIQEMAAEIGRAKGLETKLAVTNSDLDFLQHEMELVRAMKTNSVDNYSVDEIDKRRQEGMESDSLLLRSAMAELEAAKKELALVKEEGVQFMASMDVVRQELKLVSTETAQLKKLEEKLELTVHNLNSKLLGAKYKLEAATAAEEKAKALVTKLSSALQHLQSEVEVTKIEKEKIDKETESIKSEINKTNSDIDSVERRLEAAIQELEVVKASEAVALDKLRTLTEETMRTRASSALHSSTIRISDFEYEYLIGRAEGAREIAGKKVAAAQAWVEALRTSEKEIMVKTEIAHRGIRELGVVEEKELHIMEKSEAENLQILMAPIRKSFRENGTPIPSRKSKTRRQSLSSGTRNSPRSPSIRLKRKKVMPNLVRFLRGRKTGKQN